MNYHDIINFCINESVNLNISFKKALVAEKVQKETELTQKVTELESNKGSLEEQLKLEKTTASALRHQNTEKDAKNSEQVRRMRQKMYIGKMKLF